MVKFEQEARKACEEVFGSTVLQAKSPGRSTEVVRFCLEDGRSMIATKRKTDARANLEFHVLQKLATRGAKVPSVLAFNGRLLFQEDFGRRRMSLILKKVNPIHGERILNSGLISLADIHARGRAAGLDKLVATLGEGDDWLRYLVDRPRVLGQFLGIPAPKLPVEQLLRLLRVSEASFIKWDARPPNAIVLADGTTGWIDWENCGRRNRLDDLAWFFGDQSVPDWPDVEERLIRQHLPVFNDHMSLDRAHEYLAAFGSLHMCVRLGQILNREKKRGLQGWANQAHADELSQRAMLSAQRTSIRASRWAGRSPLLGSMALWLQQVADKMVNVKQAV